MTLPSIEAIVEEFTTTFGEKVSDTGIYKVPKVQADFLRTTLTTHQEQVIKACVEVLEGMKTKNTDGKTYHAGHPDVIRDQTIELAQTKLLDLTKKV